MPNLNNVQRYIAAGFARLDSYRLDSDGFPAGIDGIASTGATPNGPFRIKLVKTAAPATPPAVGEPVTGDDGLGGTFQFSDVSPRTFPIQFSEDDFLDRQMFQGIIPVAKGTAEFSARDIQPFVLNDLLMLGVSNAKAQAVGILGRPMYAGFWAKSCQMSVQGRDSYTERAAGVFSGTVTLNPFDGYPWGETFKIAEEGFLSAFVEDWTNPYPPVINRWKTVTALSKLYMSEKPATTTSTDITVYTIDANGTVAVVSSGDYTVNDTDNSLNWAAPLTAVNVVAWISYKPS